MLSAAEANSSRRKAAAVGGHGAGHEHLWVGWGLGASDVEEAVGFSSSTTCASGVGGREHAVEEVRSVLLPVLEARLRMQAESLAAFCEPKVISAWSVSLSLSLSGYIHTNTHAHKHISVHSVPTFYAHTLHVCIFKLTHHTNKCTRCRIHLLLSMRACSVCFMYVFRVCLMRENTFMYF